MANLYIDLDGKVYGFEVWQTVPNHLKKLTASEVIAQKDPQPTIDERLQQLTADRKEQERQGLKINNIRYAGDPSNRQAMQEALSFMEDAGLTEFTSWKDSDDKFHATHQLSEVRDAYRAIGERRAHLIQFESQCASQIMEGTLTDLTALVWP